MLTPAEELGLKGLGLASRVRKAFFRIPDEKLLDLTRRIRDEALARHVCYLHDGKPQPIHIMPLPLTVLPEQIAYLHHVTLTIQNALKHLPEMYLRDETVRETLRISPVEEEWLRECFGASQRDHNPMFGRLDAVVDFINPMWKDSLKFVEPNLSGIGGLHMVPTAERILAEVVLPVLRDIDEDLDLSLCQDIRVLLMQEMLEQVGALGCSATNICFVEPKYAGSGPDEQEALAQYFHTQYGTKVMHADPAELTLVGDEVFYQGDRVDLAYRDYAVYDLLDLQKQGIDVEPMRTLFRQNRIISSIGAELDQKSCWEVFTDAALTRKYFSAEERQVFRRHIPWTRIVSKRSTVLPDGSNRQLLPFLKAERERLVLKPNRSYGGEGVMIGHLVEDAEWQQAIERALADPERWVAQELVSIPVSEFPVVGPEGKIHFEPFYTVMGFAATQDGLAILGRASQKQVVNVAQRGGLCVIMQGHGHGVFHGPASGRR